jgi:hypothetical protein
MDGGAVRVRALCEGMAPRGRAGVGLDSDLGGPMMEDQEVGVGDLNSNGNSNSNVRMGERRGQGRGREGTYQAVTRILTDPI